MAGPTAALAGAPDGSSDAPPKPLSILGYLLLAIIMPAQESAHLPGRDQARANITQLRDDAGELVRSVVIRVRSAVMGIVECSRRREDGPPPGDWEGAQVRGALDIPEGSLTLPRAVPGLVLSLPWVHRREDGGASVALATRAAGAIPSSPSSPPLTASQVDPSLQVITGGLQRRCVRAGRAPRPPPRREATA